jgi:hypothetical protein
MAKCDTCGNEYHSTFQVMRNGDRYTFDSFECAIQKMAPTCEHCGCRIVGHGVEGQGKIFCCAHCVREVEGASAGVRDSA